MSCNHKTLLRNNQLLNPCSTEMLEYPWIPSTSTAFHGTESIVNFESTIEDMLPFQKEEMGDEDYDGCNQPAGKKRRLNANQVKFLERSFEVENKLEPERKAQLAKELGLQPRQVAIWFQNRRARYKTKNLEKEFDSLKSKYGSLNSDYDKLLKEKERLKQEVAALKDKLIAKEKLKKTTESAETMCFSHMEKEYLTTEEIPENLSNSSGAKSDVFNSESPHDPEQNQSGSASSEQENSSPAGEPDYSDLSQDEDDTLRESNLPPLLFLPKLEDEYYDEPPTSSCNFVFTMDDHPFFLLPY